MKILVALLLLVSPYFLFAQSFIYPPTRILTVYDTIQQIAVPDEFKWLEQTKSMEVKTWISQQNAFTDQYFRKNTRILSIEEAITDIAHVHFNYGYKQGSYYFKLLYNLNAPTPSVYFQKKLKDPPMLLVDPRDISMKDRIEIHNFELSKNEKYLAYQYSRNGTDWHQIRIADMRTKKDLKEVLEDVKFSGINWAGNGFFYTRYPRTVNSYAPSYGQQIWYHAIGTGQSQDLRVFSSDSNSTALLKVEVTGGERYLIIYERDEDKGINKIFYRDLDVASQEVKLLLSGESAQISVIGSYKDSLIALSNYENNNGEIIKFSPGQPKQWVQVTNEFEDGIIVEAKAFNEGVITVVQSDLSEYIFIYDWGGRIKKIVTFPPGYKVSGFLSTTDQKKLLFYYSSFTFPPVVYELNLETYQYKKTNEETVVSYDFENFEYEKINYPSKDGTMVPMLLVYKKGIKRNGNNPALLESYGGFGVIARSNFDPGLVNFLNEGGLYAYAFIRGEGAKGSKWRTGGRGIYKQNSFDDFIAAAEYLIKSGYTKASKLAITGASNGGLVVGAAITQRPDLFKAAVPVVGVFDMLHFEKETVGVFHKDEYGTITDTASFRSLYSYSPIHNLTASKKYPSLLIITAENDDRVPPYHSYKFSATLQKFGQQNPVLLRVIPKAGHYGDNTWEGQIKRSSEIFAFLLEELKN